MLTQILHDARMFNEQVVHLKALAPIFPEIHYEERGETVWATTMVLFEYMGTKYKRHHVESVVTKFDDYNKHLENLKRRIIHNAEMTQTFAKPYKGDEVI